MIEPYYGECSICGKVGTCQYHHIIPKMLNAKTNGGVILFYMKDEKMVEFKLPKKCLLEDIQIKLCDECHTKVHIEKKVYTSYFKNKVKENVTPVGTKSLWE